MGVYQKAVKAFLDLTCDDAMMDRWIPDEDWVRHMRLNCEYDCSVSNLNNGIAKQCVWQNNHAILQGTTIVYNKKKVQICKTKATKKTISFYYALSAGKSVPTVPSNQAFYQSLWDDPDRSNRSLKRTAPQAKKSSTLFSPDAKKSKTSDDTRAASPQTNPLL
jgi:hypothetical protein